MGTNVCCGSSKLYQSKNTHIYQINRYYIDPNNNPKDTSRTLSAISESRQDSEIIMGSLYSKGSYIDNRNRLNSEVIKSEDISVNENSIDNSFKRKQFLKNKNGKFQLYSYDIEEENFLKFLVTFPIIKTIEGLSELTINSNFYLCGISPKQKDEGSYLFKVDLGNNIIDDNINAQILINSQFPHVYPALISDKNGQIICVGGKGQIQCELYNCNLNKWYMLPKLPEERYKCSLCIDAKNEFLYLFGGSDFKKNINENDIKEFYVLKLDLIKQLVWEKIIVKNWAKNININRSLAGGFTFKNDEDFIFLIGGEDSENNFLDDIIRFSIKNSNFESTGIKLKYKAKFINQYGILSDEQTYYFIDSLNQIHTIERHDCLPMDYHPSEI